MKTPCVEKNEPQKINYLRLSITDRCDLCCAYCMPSGCAIEHVESPLSLHEIGILVNGFTRNGITKVRITGGEPLMRDDVVDIVRNVIQSPGIQTVGLTTNGMKLVRYASDLVQAGLKSVNISLDTLNPETFRRITSCDRLCDVLAGIDAALDAGFEKVKINTVVMRGINDTELPEIVSFAQDRGLDARFIELMPLGHSSDKWRSMYVSADEIRDILGNPSPQIDQGSCSAQLFDLPGGTGTVGIISPMSRPFCDACNRIRVTSAGVIKSCLRLHFEEDIRLILSKPDFNTRLGEIVTCMSRHKLSGSSAVTNVIDAKAMSSVGG
ncbi:MAG: GTP 3',8-cyclase MoaA [Armatimonadota bacterium]